MLSERNWKLESVLRLGLGVFFCLCLGTLLAALVGRPADPKAAPSVARIIASSLCFQGATLVLAWRFLREHQTDWATGFGLRRNEAKAIGLGALAVGLFLPLGWRLQTASMKLMKLCGLEPSEQLALVALRNSGSIGQFVALGIVAILLAPVAEEILFRGVLYPFVKQQGFPRVALWGTSALFAAIHFSLAIFVPLLLLAALLVWLYEKTDNLLAPIAAHITFNAVNFAMFFVIHDPAQKIPASS